MITSLIDVMTIVDNYTHYLQEQGVHIDKHGFPLLDAHVFLNKWPDRVVPYGYRNTPIVESPETTVLCFYCADRLIYPRIENALRDLPIYRSYMGVIGADVTVTTDMDPEWQAEIMLLNHLFTAVLAVNGVKVVANLRCGGPNSEEYLSAIPQGVMCASGFLGCGNVSEQSDLGYISKIMRVLPSKLILYGKRDRIAETQLDTCGIPWRRYEYVRSGNLLTPR